MQIRLIPSLKKKFPYCSNGIVRGSKPGYDIGETSIQTGRRLDTSAEEAIGGTFTFNMAPVALFNFTVVKHKMLNNGVTGAVPLDSNENAMITIISKEQNFESYATYPIDGAEEQPELKLLAGKDFTYDLEIYVVDNETIRGGYKNDKWLVSRVTTVLNKNLTFHVVEKDFDSEEEQYIFLAGLKEYSKLVPLPEPK